MELKENSHTNRRCHHENVDSERNHRQRDASVKADLLIDGATIKEVRAGIPASAADKVVDATGLLLLPGGIDAHTHLDMPFGGTYSADDFETARAPRRLAGRQRLSISPSRRAGPRCAPRSTPGGRRPRARPASTTACT
jgi:cytosine/adenosine deaminase-related metal-dependent hydrolase